MNLWYNERNQNAARVFEAPTAVTLYRRVTMSDSIPQKRCSKCKQFFSATTEYFNRAKKASDGLRTECKVCRRPSTHAYYRLNKEKILRYTKEYNKTHYQAWYESEKKWEKANPDKVKAADKRQREKYPEKVKARQAVHAAVQSGKLAKVSTCFCTHCGMQAQTYHHESYAHEHWLDVIPLCRKCHTVVHIK